MVSDVVRAIARSSSMNQGLWVADPRQVAFLCLAKEKLPKERRPRSLRRPLIIIPSPASGGGLGRGRCPAPLGKAAREANSPAAKDSPLGIKHRLANARVLSCGGRFARPALPRHSHIPVQHSLALGGLNSNHPRCPRLRWVCCWVPVWRGFEHRRVWGEACQGSGQEVRSQSTAHGSAVDWRGPQSREAQKLFAPFGVSSLWVLSLGQARESTPTCGAVQGRTNFAGGRMPGAIWEPQVQFHTSTIASTGAIDISRREHRPIVA